MRRLFRASVYDGCGRPAYRLETTTGARAVATLTGMTARSSLGTVLRERPLLVDAALAAGVFVLALVLRDPESVPAVSPTVPGLVVVAALTCVALVWRRAAPRRVLAVSVVGNSAVLFTAEVGTGLVAGALLALYAVAVSTDRRTTCLAWVATVLPLTVATLLSGAPLSVDSVVGYLPWTALAAAIGDALRNRRAYILAVEERAERAERTREEEAQLRVAQERMRIARDLHDVVAHRIAVVNVQAGVAGHLLTSQPERAREALEHVRQAGAAILDELGEVLDVLRQTDESDLATAPVPGLAQLDFLVTSFATAGLAVETTFTGSPRPVGTSVDVVTYRVLQEALTNAHKHGTGTAHLSLTYTPSALDIQVTNPVKTSGPSTMGTPTAGHGLLGMQERTIAVGGELEAAPGPVGQFHVDVRLPIPAGATR